LRPAYVFIIAHKMLPDFITLIIFGVEHNL
jgi:hypothetical protein